MGSGVRNLVLGSALAVAAATACYTGPHADDGFLPTPTPDPTTDTSATEPLVGLPCDVAQLLANNCRSCHGQTLQGAAVTQLLSRDDLRADYQGRVVASVALERMRNATNPMPPQGGLPDDQIAILEQWISQGMPAGECDGSEDSAGPTTPAPVATTCTSGTHWTRGDHGSALMKPGAACIHCHATGGEDDDDDQPETRDHGPTLSFAGTVYPAAHDEEDCNGSDATDTTTVVLTGADGKVLTLPINAAGNFYTAATLAIPVTARVVSAAGTRKMKTPVQDGDCNKCHTATSLSPGRLIEKR